MKARSLFTGFLSMVFAALLLAGCANQMEPAQKAIADIEAAITAAGPDASQYIPDELQAVTSQLADLKAKFDQKDYKGVLAAAPALLTQAQGLAGAASSARQAAEDGPRCQQPGGCPLHDRTLVQHVLVLLCLVSVG